MDDNRFWLCQNWSLHLHIGSYHPNYTLALKYYIEECLIGCTSVLTSIGVKAWINTKPSIQPKTFVALEKNLILKVISSLVGYNFGVSLSPPPFIRLQFAPHSMHTKFKCKYGVGLCFMGIKRWHHQMWHYLSIGLQTHLVQLFIFLVGFECFLNDLTNLFFNKLLWLSLASYSSFNKLRVMPSWMHTSFWSCWIPPFGCGRNIGAPPSPSMSSFPPFRHLTPLE